MNNLPDIEYKKISKNPTIDSDNSVYELPFYKDDDYFSNLDNYTTFIHASEKMIRTSNQYTKYIKYLKENIDLTYCQVLSNITDEDAAIEMHHGPILTLFDYCCIITDYLLSENRKINTFIVSDIVLKEHFENNIQIVMLSKTVHEQVHEHNIFLNLNQAFGNLNNFIKKYRNGIFPELINKINKYIDMSMERDSYDRDVLKLSDTVHKWVK